MKTVCVGEKGVGERKKGRSSEREAADGRRRRRVRRPENHIEACQAVNPLPSGEGVVLPSNAREHPRADLQDAVSGQAGDTQEGEVICNPVETATSPRPNNTRAAPELRRALPAWVGPSIRRLPPVVALGLRFAHGALFPSPKTSFPFSRHI